MMEYPQYRKYKNIETYFLIHSDRVFEEIKVIGGKYSISKVEAKQYPEQLLIQDMLNNLDDRWDTVDANVFEMRINNIIETKLKIG